MLSQVPETSCRFEIMEVQYVTYIEAIVTLMEVKYEIYYPRLLSDMLTY